MTGALAGTSGAKIVVHDPSLPPLLEENTIDLKTEHRYVNCSSNGEKYFIVIEFELLIII
jgi:hypothetical protein